MDSAFAYAHDTKASYFEYLQQRPALANDFNTFMQGVRSDRTNWMDWFPVQQQVLEAAKNDAGAVLLIDLGGGRGHDLMAFRDKFPKAQGRLILQDQPHVVEGAILRDGVEGMGHDFFTPQPIKGASTGFLSRRVASVTGNSPLFGSKINPVIRERLPPDVKGFCT